MCGFVYVFSHKSKELEPDIFRDQQVLTFKKIREGDDEVSQAKASMEFFQFMFLMVGIGKYNSTMNLELKIYLIHEGSQRLKLGFAPKCAA